MRNGMRDLPERVRDARQKLGLTQRQFAEKAGVKPRAYQNFEGGHATPQPANLRAILRAAGLDAGGEAVAEATRAGFAPDVQFFLDTIGIWLDAMDQDSRTAVIHDLTRQIVTGGLTPWRSSAHEGTHG